MSITELLSGVSLGAMQVHSNLCMFPLLVEDRTESGYLLLDEALEQGTAHITEVSESGSVPELKFVNEGFQPVLLMDGEELVGAKQNRILNLTVLAPAQKTIVIPVSCVEAGRWHAESVKFSTAGRAHFSRGRAKKAAQVSESMRSDNSRQAFQDDVWNEIEEKSVRMRVSSPTSAAEALYEANRENLEDYLKGFTAVDNQMGALFAINGEIIGFDLFDSAITLGKQLPKLVQSFALDAIDEAQQASAPPTTKSVESFLESVSNTEVDRFPAVGEGADLRLKGERLAGGGLLYEDRLIHLCVFKLPDDSDGKSGDSSNSRVIRASRRQRHWIH